MIRRPPRSTLFPTRRSSDLPAARAQGGRMIQRQALAGALLCAATLAAQQAPRDQASSATQLKTAIDTLGKFDAATRTAAARLVRRAPAAQAVPALIEA